MSLMGHEDLSESEQTVSQTHPPFLGREANPLVLTHRHTCVPAPHSRQVPSQGATLRTWPFRKRAGHARYFKRLLFLSTFSFSETLICKF